VPDDQGVLTGLGFPAAANVDPNLFNPSGVSFSPTSPFWVSDNGNGFATLYTAGGAQVSPPSLVTIATPMGQPPGTVTPAGQVFHSDTSTFVVSNGIKAGAHISSSRPKTQRFLGEARLSMLLTRFLSVNHSGSGAVYKSPSRLSPTQ
jgi:hypothetical protein